MPQEFELSYIPDSSTLLVSYSLPSVDAIPRLREVTYLQTRDEFSEKTLVWPVRLEFPILSLHPGLRQRCVAPDV